MNGSASYINPWVIEGNQEPRLYCEYMTDLLTDASINFISRSAYQPFFAYLSYSAPHTPLEVDDSVSSDPYNYIINNLSSNIERLTDHLKDLGIYDNTLIFFLSDNGCSRASKACKNEILKGNKGILYEGGIRVPFIMKLPKDIKVSSLKKVDAAVSSLDIMPTIIEVVGGSKDANEETHGISLVQQMREGFNKERTLYFRDAIIKGN
ncbi:MAG: sulfatase-like hydrolase/transferase [Ekhidna sp.]|nr:sulfatase-like hydrolase/transferase [Ekhidna sp.]